MQAVSGHPSLVTIERLHAQYLVPADHPENLRGFCEDVAKDLPQSLVAVLHRHLSAEDPSLWFVRRLEVEVSLNVEAESGRLCSALASEIAAGVSRILAGDATGEVIRFASRTIYLAHFLTDLADGQAWNKWYHAQFEGLRLLPVSAAIRTAVCDDPRAGLAALTAVPNSRVPGVLDALSEADARRVIVALSAAAPDADGMTCLSSAWSAMEAAGVPLLRAIQEARYTLKLFLMCCRERAELACVPLRDAVAALVRLANRLSESSARHGKQLLAVLRTGEIAALQQATANDDALTLAPLLRCPADWLGGVVEKLVHEAGQPADKRGRPKVRFTPFGGLFLLLPLLDELPLMAATAGWPEPEGATALALSRFLVLQKCLGGGHAAGLFFDPMVRDLMQIPPEISPVTVARWLTRVTELRAQTFFAAIAGCHLQSRTVEGRTLVLARAKRPGAPAWVLLDGCRGLWLAAGYRKKRADNPLFDLSDSLPEPERVFCEKSLIVVAQKCFPRSQITLLAHDGTADVANADDELPSINRLAQDFAYLALARVVSGFPSANLALSSAAQNVLCLLAWKLPGFARSSLPYIYGNFLDCTASVEDEPTRRVVRLSRPSFQMVLSMAGLTRRSYRLSWQDDRPCEVFLEE